MRVPAFLITTCALLQSATAMASSLSDAAEEWLTAPLFDSRNFNVEFKKSKVAFANCKQKTYQLALESYITDTFAIEARLNQGKGRTQYGVLNQTVTTRGFDVVSWWAMGDVRLGLGHSSVSDHEIDTPGLSGISLPTSRAVVMEMEFEGLKETHQVNLSLKKETWEAKDASMFLPWRRASENKLEMSYSMQF